MDAATDRFWRLLEPEHRKAELFCRRLTGDKAEGDDLYQEAVLAALQGLKSLRVESAFRPWLYRIIVNRYRKLHRSPWRIRRTEVAEETLAESSSVDPTDRFAAKRWLERAFRVLSPKEKALIVLYQIEGWSISELAQLYRRPEGTIKASLSRTRRKMRETLVRYLTPTLPENRTCEATYAMPRSENSPE